MPEERDLDLRAPLEQALTRSENAAVRLASAETTVAFRCDGGRGVVLLLDREPPAVGEDDSGAEVEIDLDADQAERFVRGELNLPLATSQREVDCRGPIRKYLVVDAILRAQLRRLADDA